MRRLQIESIHFLTNRPSRSEQCPSIPSCIPHGLASSARPSQNYGRFEKLSNSHDFGVGVGQAWGARNERLLHGEQMVGACALSSLLGMKQC